MQNLKLLNKKYLSIFFLIIFCGFASQSQEPVDIWNVEEKQQNTKNDIIEKIEEKNIPQNTIYEMQSQKKN